MGEFIWYLQAAGASSTSRGYTPELGPDEGRFAAIQEHRILLARADKGKEIDPSELRTKLLYKRTDPDRKLDLPLWHALATFARKDVVAVMRAFEMGKTVFAQVEIVLDDDGNTNTDYFTFMTSNVKQTIDPELSEPIGVGDVRRGRLSTGKKIHPGVVASRTALQGPDLWIDPDVSSTLFVSDRLAAALLSEEFGKKLMLKNVRVKGSEV